VRRAFADDLVSDDIEHVIGGSGDDTLVGTDVANVIAGGAGDDTIDGSLGDDDLDGGPGTDTVSFASLPAGVTVDLPAGAAGALRGDERDTLRGFEHVVGTQDVDRLYGDDGANVLRGESGADLLYGGAGRDMLDGGPGEDTLLARDGVIDVVVCGAGRDTVDADLEDVLVDCETVQRPPLPPPPAPPAPPPAPAPDTTAPDARVTVPAQRLATVRRRGLKVTVDCREACTIVGTARLRGIVGRSATTYAPSGRRTITIRLNRRARSAKRLSVTITAADRQGNVRTVRRTVRLRL
jgi:Ca2+-binding RTX toxin-like protein